MAFPSHLKVNQKHYSYNDEVIKILNNIIILNVTAKRKALALPTGHPVLLIMDAFKDKMTEHILKGLSIKHIILQILPGYLTYLFQLLDVKGGTNGCVK